MNSKTAEAFARVIDKAHDQVEQARSQAIDDCIKVAQEEVDAAEELLARHVHCGSETRALLKAQLTTAKAILSRLESLKLMPSPQDTEK